MQVIKTFLKRNLVPLLRCIVLYWTVTGCVHDIMEEKPYTYLYTPPKTPPRDLHTLVDKRIGVYKTQIQACKKHLSLKKEAEELFYADIRVAHREFSKNNHPDGGGDEEKFKKGGGAWDNLNKTLDEDDEEGKYTLGEENLKDVKEALLTYLKKYLKTHIEKNVETYREKDSATPPQ